MIEKNAIELSVPRFADVAIIGPVDGMNERHPEGSYFRLVTTRGDDERHQFLLSRGAAETLRDELIGALR